MKSLLPVILLCLAALPLFNCRQLDRGFRSRTRREVPYVRTTRRASLHELLKNRGSVASVASPDDAPAAERGPTDSSPTAPSDKTDSNRRVLVVGEGDELPNYIYDDSPPTTDTKDLDFETNDSDDDYGGDSKTNSKAAVTRYVNPFSAVNAPSYADPDLLSAVMSQADKANYRFPGEGSPSQFQRYTPTSERVKSSAVDPSLGLNMANKYNLFPPAFHELLNIPMHIHKNGSAKFDSPKQADSKLQAPKISGGYASTNVNGPSISSFKSKTEPQTEISPSLSKYKPAVRRTTTLAPTTEIFPNTTPPPQQTSFANTRQRPVYTDVKRKPAASVVEDYVPTLDAASHLETKSNRPSLQFRTPATIIEKPIVDKPRESTIFETHGDFPNESQQEKRNEYKPLNPFYDHEAVKKTNEHLNPQFDFKTVTKEVDLHTDNIDFDSGNFGSKIKPESNYGRESSLQPPQIISRKEQSYQYKEVNPPKPQSYQYKEVIPTKEQSYQYKEVIPREEITYSNAEIIPKREPVYKPSEVIQIRENFNKPKEILQRKEPVYKPANENQRRDQPFRHVESIQKIEHPTFRPAEVQRKETIIKLQNDSPKTKLPFKPSKVDPFINNGNNAPFFSEHSQEKVSPTTFRPIYNSFGNQYVSVPPRNTYNIYDTQGAKTPYTNRRYENVNPYSKPVRNQGVGINTEFSYERHPSIERYAFEQEHQAGHFIPPHLRTGEAVTRTDELYSDFNGSLRPPPNFNQENFAQVEGNQYSASPQQRRRVSKPQRKRPSLLKNFGFFKRRSGVTGPNSDINSLKVGLSEKESSKYMLTKGPIPHNAQKVTVIGPFKSPPIGAPKVYPHYMASQSDSILPTVPSTMLIPPSPLVALANEIETSAREPSFKVINLPKEDVSLNRKNYSVADKLIDTLPEAQKLKSDKTVESSDIIYGKDAKSKPRYVNSQSTVVDVDSMFHVRSSENDRQMIKPQTSFQGRYDEVSQADKDRIIAAKFVFPRSQTVRRSGFDSHVIPIPVPLLGTSGKQVHQMQTIILPQLPIKRSMHLEPQRKAPRRVDIANILTPNDHTQSQDSKQSFDSHQSYTSHSILSSVVDESSRNMPTIYEDHNTNENSAKEVGRLDKLTPEKPESETDITPSPFNSPPMRITPYPAKSSIDSDKSYEEPQSFQEPQNSPVSYGGWKVIGESKVDPHGALDPIVSFVVENTPEIQLKSPQDKETNASKDSNNFEESQHNLPHFAADIINGRRTTQNEGSPNSPFVSENKEDKLVKYSTKVNIEGPQTH